MPCSDSLAWDRHIEQEKREAMEKAMAEISPLLCSACRTLERLGYDFDENPALSEWYANHKRADEAREEAEARARFEKKLVTAALEKPLKDLTDAEKKLLVKHKYL